MLVLTAEKILSRPATVPAVNLHDNDILSTIIRFHKKERLPLLEEALFSLAIQSWPDHEVVITLQNGTDEIKEAIAEIMSRQPWSSGHRWKIISIDVPKGVDGRSTLLNRGIEHAQGRYLAFLDDDDFVYQHGYLTLINQLKKGEAVLAAGGCRMSKTQYLSDHWYIHSKETPFSWGRTRNDLLRDNFIPIHSYVLDRARIDPGDLYFDDELPPLEDYELLLRLCAKYQFDFSALDIPVCEYRIHDLNSLPYVASASPESHLSHRRAQQLINERKEKLVCYISARELVDMEAAYRQTIVSLEGQVAQEAQHRIHEQNRFLNTLARKVYTFFGRFPRLERQISNYVHSGWRAYKRMSSR